MGQLQQLVEFFQITRFSFRDALDILLVAFIVYRVLLLIRGTRGFHMAVGLIFVIVAYYSTQAVQLRTVTWLLTNIFTYSVFALIVLYQSEIRSMLAHIGRNPLLRRISQQEKKEDHYAEIVLAAITLSAKRIGALIIIEREIGLKNYIESGIHLDAVLTYDLLINIFTPKTPLHDGASIVQGDRIAASVCFLPLTLDPHLSKELGTRHRAAIGITSETDAVAIVVSEETGYISGMVNGEIQRRLDIKSLRLFLDEAFEPKVITIKRAKGLKRIYGFLKNSST